MKLFYLSRLRSLPAELQVMFYYTFTASILIVVEFTAFAIIKYETVTPWIIPLIGIAYSLSMFVADRLSDVPLKTLWSYLYVIHTLGALSWVVLILAGHEWIYLVIFLTVIDGVFWTAQSVNMKALMAANWPNSYKEYDRVKTHNLVLPEVLASLLASGALYLGMTETLWLIVLLYVPHQLILNRYRVILSPVADQWVAAEGNTKRQIAK